ncbi:hypothetical protein LTR35_018117 [Friedmanniomyces endolithicus]|nr:hypothetical protein LTR35_018117 [Friedmanniomyces endolithicus]
MSLPPETDVLGLWPYATDEPVQFYKRGYAALYPDALLLLLEYSTIYDRQIGNALDVLTTLDEKFTYNLVPKVLLHLFGGYGAAQGCRLLRAYKLRTGQRLAVRAVISDSVPRLVVPSVRTATRSPQLLLSFLYILLTVIYIRVVFTINYWQKWYIFAEKDLMFSWHDSPAQDDEECVRDDVSVKRTNIDGKGTWTSDQERYWQGIENLWDGGAD